MVASTEPLTLTLDTNVIRDVVDPTREQGLRDRGRRLLDLHWARECDIALTTEIDFDVPGGWLAGAIDLLVLDERPPTGDDAVGDQEPRKLTGDIARIIGPGTDVEHVIAHHLSGRYAFVTRDENILRSGDELRARFGIRVMRPREAIEHIERLQRMKNEKTRGKGS